ncbi:MAG: DUF1365 domain-containing protein [Acidobacteriota bacterium]
MSAPAPAGLLVGQVAHSRLGPRAHAFVYRLFMLRLDLAALPALDRTHWLFGLRRWKPVRFDVSDFLGVPPSSGSAEADLATLRSAVQLTLVESGVRERLGRIEVVAHARIFGYVFNPISFFLCYGADSVAGIDAPLAVIADVRNTFGQRHAYVLPAAHAIGDGVWTAKKVFHVSPFFTLDGTYRFQLSFADGGIDARIDLHDGGRPLLVTHLRLARRPLTDRALAAALIRLPFMTVRVIAAIYWEALRLWRKGLPYHPKPAYDPARARATRP